MATPFDIFGAVSGSIGIVGTAFSIIDGLVNHGLSGDFGGDDGQSVDDLINERFDALQETLDTLQGELSSLIVSQFEGVRQQALMSAVSRAESARDLLASVDASDLVEPSEIIADASRALRDVVAQASAIAEETGEYDPSLDQVQTAFAAVGLTLAVRMEVAAKLEAGELGSDRISRQIDAAADFFESAEQYFRDALDLELNPVSRDGDVVGVEGILKGLQIPDPNWVHEGDAPMVNLRLMQNFEIHPVWGNYASTRFEGLNGSSWVTPVVTDGEFSEHTASVIRGQWEPRLEAEALNKIGFGFDAADLKAMVANYRSLTDGIEAVVPSRHGYDNSGEITGTEGNDLLIGNDGNDVLVALGEGDIARGREGNDRLDGGAGEDRLEGGAGDDGLFGGADADTLVGGAGNDVIDGGGGVDTAVFFGRRGDYTISVEFGDGLIVSGPEGRDMLIDVERIFFSDANHMVVPRAAGEASSLGTEAGEILFGSAGSDELSGLGGDDIIISGDGQDLIEGGAGNDVFDGGPLYPRPGEGDIASYASSRHDNSYGFADPETLTVSGPEGEDRMTLSVEELRFLDGNVAVRYGDLQNGSLEGGEGSDILHDRSGTDMLQGHGGNDLLAAAGLDGTIDGGAGWDTVRIFGAASEHVTDHDGHDVLVRALGAEAGASLRMVDVEQVVFDDGEARIFHGDDRHEGLGVVGEDGYWMFGHGGGDSLHGAMGADRLFGGDGSDSLYGGGNADTLVGGSGDDRLAGAAGADRFAFDIDMRGALAGEHGVDVIRDFEIGVDQLLLTGSAFAGLGGEVTAENLLLGGTPQEPDDILFVDAGVLHVDPDGSGNSAAIAFAVFENGAMPGAADILVGDTSASNEPARIEIEGDPDGREDLVGTDAADIFVSGGGRDTMTGGGGADLFVFGDEVVNGRRDRDAITDFEVDHDEIVLAEGVEIAAIRMSSQGLLVEFAGDGDVLNVHGEDLSVLGVTFTTEADIAVA